MQMWDFSLARLRDRELAHVSDLLHKLWPHHLCACDRPALTFGSFVVLCYIGGTNGGPVPSVLHGEAPCGFRLVGRALGYKVWALELPIGTFIAQHESTLLLRLEKAYTLTATYDHP